MRPRDSLPSSVIKTLWKEIDEITCRRRALQELAEQLASSSENREDG